MIKMMKMMAMNKDLRILKNNVLIIPVSMLTLLAFTEKLIKY